MTEQQLSQEEQDTITATDIIEEFYTLNSDEAIMVRTVIEELGGENFAKLVREAREEAVKEWSEMGEMDRAETGATEEEFIDAYIKSEIESTLLGYDLEEPDRHYDYYRIKDGNREYGFCIHEQAEAIAKERIDNLIDEGGISQETIIQSWSRGQSRSEYVEEVLRYDGMGFSLSSYDGNYEEQTVDGETWVYWREN